MKVKPAARMYDVLMKDLRECGFPKHIAERFIDDGEFDFSRKGLIFDQPLTGYRARWTGKSWASIKESRDDQ